MIYMHRSEGLTECALLLQEAHLHAAPCLAVEHEPQGHPVPWIEIPPLADDDPVVDTLRCNC